MNGNVRDLVEFFLEFCSGGVDQCMLMSSRLTQSERMNFLFALRQSGFVDWAGDLKESHPFPKSAVPSFKGVELANAVSHLNGQGLLNVFMSSELLSRAGSFPLFVEMVTEQYRVYLVATVNQLLRGQGGPGSSSIERS